MTATTSAPAARQLAAGRPVAATGRWAATDWAFAAFLAAYAGFAVSVLTIGLVSIAAGVWPSLHDRLHLAGLLPTLWGRLAEAIGAAAHAREPLGGLALDYAFSLFNLVLAGILLWLQPRERTARLLAVGMIGTAAVFNLQAYRVYEAMAERGTIILIHDAFHVVAAACYIAALLLFPDGHLVPRWGRSARAALYVPVAAVLLLAAGFIDTASRTLVIVLLFGLIAPAAGVAAQAYRHRRAQTPIERQQSRLLFWALIPSLGVGALALAPGILTSIQPVYENRPIPVIPVLLFHVFQVAFAVIPLALVVGLLRFRLWQIDRVISRALAYGALAAMVGGLYVGLVVALGSLVGGPNTLTSVVAAGAVAAAVAPAQRVVQRGANRLVYGTRATPYEVLSALSERMGDALPAEDAMHLMARLLRDATSADRVDVWLVVGDEARPAARWPAEAQPPEPRAMPDGTLPDLGPATATSPVRHGAELLGALTVTKPRGEMLAPREHKLLSDLAAQAALVLRNAQLTAELVDRLAELRASRQRMVHAQDEARRNLERNLHDGAQQQLVALKIKLGLAQRLSDAGKPVGSLLGNLTSEIGEAIDTLRDLARGIYPPLLADEGLVAALRAQALKAPLPVSVEAEALGRFDQNIEAAVYFCCLEALQNIAKYAHAAKAHISLSFAEQRLHFEVRDDGQGFDPASTSWGSGLQNMADRLDALDGELHLEARPGVGTTLRGGLPARQVTQPSR